MYGPQSQLSLRSYGDQREKAREMLTIWIKKQLTKQKERQMDKKRSFYKWLVLTQSKHYLKVVDVMVKNSKMTQSKAAYILW